MSLRYGSSYWLDTFPKSRLPAYPRHRGDLSVDIAIVGGGFAACASAYAFSAAGIKVALFESDQIGRGSTAFSSGLVLQEPGVDYRDVEQLYGVRVARRVFQQTHRAALELAGTLRRLRIECGLEPKQLVRVALMPDDDKALRREWQMRKSAGLEAAFLNTRLARSRVKIDRYGAIQTRDHARFDPYRACLGFARAAAARGALVFDESPVRRVRFGRKSAEVKTERGLVTASTVVIATERAGDLFRPLQRHFKTFHRYHVVTSPLPAAVRRELAAEIAVVTDTASPPHWVQRLPNGRAICSGADQPQVPARIQDKVRAQRTGQLMYELSTLYPAISGVMPEYGWDSAYGRTADGLPYLGPHRNYPRHLFALGCGLGGPALAFLGSRILLRHFLKQPAKGDEFFDFSRARS
ncbi:MAG TPA: FAD-binding oxidoreductase [Vicinamibacterales bacterium]|jgi:glycine/D-amino acid oxidase-like deaminating enzyme